MKSTDEINHAILDLWRKTTPSDRGDLLPLLLTPLKKRSLLFVGFNPSFSKRLSEDNTPKFKYRELSADEIKITAGYDTACYDTYPYFTKMRKIAKELDLEFQHLDLFFIRCTNQAEVENQLLTKEGFRPFGKQQFELFLAALKLAEPKCVVVANAKSSSILKGELDLQLSNDVSVYYTSSEIDCPFHLGSMLSGQRAMDVHSVERLTHAIKTSLGLISARE
jgi:hypothetical protein